MLTSTWLHAKITTTSHCPLPHPCRQEIADLCEQAGKPLSQVLDAQKLAKQHGVRLANPGILGFGFQPTFPEIFENPTDNQGLCENTGLLMNDIQQCMVPDEMHVFRGVWDSTLDVGYQCAHISSMIFIAMYTKFMLLPGHV